MSNNLAPDRSQVCQINPLNAELNPICHLLALLGAHHILHVSRIGVNGILPKLWKTNNFIGPRMYQNGPGRQSCCNQLIYSLLIRACGTLCSTKIKRPEISKSRTGSHVTYSCHHNSSCFSFPIFVNSWRFSVFHSLQSIMPCIY